MPNFADDNFDDANVDFTIGYDEGQDFAKTLMSHVLEKIKELKANGSSWEYLQSYCDAVNDTLSDSYFGPDDDIEKTVVEYENEYDYYKPEGG
jgi:hypothetical protein